MAIDNNSLCYLFDPIFQVENIRGIPIVGGHIEVFIAGTDQKYITWQNFDGARNPFKIPLNNDGRATILVEPNYTYDAYIYDSFNNMVCSRLNIRPVVGGDIVVSGITQVWHDESLSGDGTLQSPLTVVSAGKVYSGVAPIVVNNDEDKISANHVALGLQEPLYFVEDSESACIIGIDSSACGKTYSGISPILVDNTANTISITGDIGKDWTEEIISAANDASAAATAWTDSQGYLTALPEDLVYTGDLSDYAKKDFVNDSIDSATSGLLPTSSFSSVSGSFLTALPSDLVYTADITGKQDITGMTAYQPKSAMNNYLTNFAASITYQPTAGMTAYQEAGNYYSASNPSGFITGINYNTGSI